MGPDRIDHRGLLTDGSNERHIRPRDRFADCLGINGIILVPLHVGLYIGRRHQPHGMTKSLELSRPMMRRGAGFDADQKRRKLLKER